MEILSFFLDLIKRRESILRREFDMVLRIINKSIPAENHLRFLHWDLHENSLENL
jgi:hypothetical protein